MLILGIGGKGGERERGELTGYVQNIRERFRDPFLFALRRVGCQGGGMLPRCLQSSDFEASNN